MFYEINDSVTGTAFITIFHDDFKDKDQIKYMDMLRGSICKEDSYKGF